MKKGLIPKDQAGGSEMFDPENPTAWLKREDGTLSEDGLAYLKLMNDPEFMESFRKLLPVFDLPSPQPRQS